MFHLMSSITNGIFCCHICLKITAKCQLTTVIKVCSIILSLRGNTSLYWTWRKLTVHHTYLQTLWMRDVLFLLSHIYRSPLLSLLTQIISSLLFLWLPHPLSACMPFFPTLTANMEFKIWTTAASPDFNKYTVQTKYSAQSIHLQGIRYQMTHTP